MLDREVVLRSQLPIALLGAGSWGSALAILIARNGRDVVLWSNDAAQVTQMQEQRRNVDFLPDIKFPDRLNVSADLKRVLEICGDIMLVVPSEAFRSVLALCRPMMRADARLSWATKGFDPGSGKLLHQVAAEICGDEVPFAVVSGPSFAHEVAIGLPTALTVASGDTQFSQDLSDALSNDCFRAYRSHDVIGVEVAGAVKNVLAIAAGISDGLGFGANARAALITRGLAEITRLGVELGGQADTFTGLAGLGDLVLTCTDNQSRNRRMGLALAQGKTLEQALQSIGQAVEGVQTAREVLLLARQCGVEMPIAEQVYRVLYQGCSPRDAVSALFERAQKTE
ncbi:MAG: NAD(P)-dependent glycerol-3-phosphate dehydrogenase [Thiotrichaceae bacterium]|nr:NAD(P)-dependent glycerol-3-phosphate dehydrogenase [Thiotrichaceae bacterium]